MRSKVVRLRALELMIRVRSGLVMPKLICRAVSSSSEEISTSSMPGAG